MKVVVGVFAAAVVGLGAYTGYQYVSGNFDSPSGCCASRQACQEPYSISCCDEDVATIAQPGCCASMSRVSASKGCCMEGGESAVEVLAVMPHEVK
jgi:hypothetical protein